MLLDALLAFLAFAASLLFVFRPAWFPIPISADAIAYDRQFSRTLWITGVIFVAAQIALAWVVFRGVRRRRPAASRPPPWLEWAWSIATAALFIALGATGSRAWARISHGAAGKEVIEVDAHQFAWNFRYPGRDGRFGKTAIQFISDAGGNPLGIDPGDPAGRDDIVTSTLRVPVGRDVVLRLHTRDVIHDFFVRELRTKQDIVPGMEMPFDLRVDRAGSYEIACAELCGLGHSQMRSLLIAMPADEYDRWKLGR